MIYELDEDEGERMHLREGEQPESGQGYLELRVYRLAHELGVAAHHLSLTLPKYEMYETGSQLRRAPNQCPPTSWRATVGGATKPSMFGF